jgi:hypothetical protein
MPQNIKYVKDYSDTYKLNCNIFPAIIGEDIKILRSISNDNRSYHISSDKIFKLLKFKPEFTISDAINDLKKAFENKLLIDPLNNENYYNIKKMKNINLA